MKIYLLLINLLLLVSCSGLRRINRGFIEVINPNAYEKYQITNRDKGSFADTIVVDRTANLLSADETIKLLNDGYIILGYSNFTSKKKYLAKHFTHSKPGKMLSTNLIVYASEYKGTTSSILPVSVPTTSTVHHSGNISSSNYNAPNYNYQGTSITDGTQVTYVPVSTKHYANSALFLAKSNICKSLTFGFESIEASRSMQKKFGRRDIFRVTRVCRDGSAYHSGLFVGDFFHKIQKNNKKLDLLIYRNNKKIRVRINIKSKI